MATSSVRCWLLGSALEPEGWPRAVVRRIWSHRLQITASLQGPPFFGFRDQPYSLWIPPPGSVSQFLPVLIPFRVWFWFEKVWLVICPCSFLFNFLCYHLLVLVFLAWLLPVGSMSFCLPFSFWCRWGICSFTGKEPKANGMLFHLETFRK